MARKDGPLSISIINMKGGVGKSTIAALLCDYASKSRGLDVLAIDLDPQANLSQAFMGSDYTAFLTQQQPSIVEVFNGYQPPRAGSGAPGPLPQSVAVTASRLGTNTLQIIPSRFDFSDHLVQAAKPDPHVLARYLADHFRTKDLIIVDCAPTESVLTRAAYHASSQILVPVKPEYFATIGFPLLRESLDNFRAANRGHSIDVCGVVINNGFYHGGNDGGPEKREALRDIRTEAQANRWRIFERQIPFSRGFPKLMRGNRSYLGNAPLFNRFAQEFFQAIGL